MAFRICRSDDSVTAAVQRIACEQIDKALAEIADEGLECNETVHQVRKRCKKVRGLIRLVRPQFERTYRKENSAFRDAANSLSSVRDAQSMIETFDSLTTYFSDVIDVPSFEAVREELACRRDAATRKDGNVEGRLADFACQMREARERIVTWQLKETGFHAVADGLEKTYSRGRDAMKLAYSQPDAERFHDWRKRVKYHWYHLRLLRPIWSGPMKARRDELSVLAELLGDDHDLTVLHETLIRSSESFGDVDLVQKLCGLIIQRQCRLRRRSRSLGARVYAEKPSRFEKRLRQYWNAWQRGK